MGDGRAESTSMHVSRVQRAVEERIANPLLRRLLRSPLHRPASRWLVLVSYVGRRSGRRFTFPVAYHRIDGGVVAVTPRHESDWWRNFREGHDCRLWLRGEAHDGTGELVTGDERGPLLAGYARDHRLLARGLGLDADAPPARLADAHPELAVVRFRLDDGRTGRRDGS